MIMGDVWAVLAETHALMPTTRPNDRADIVLQGPGFPETAYDVTKVSTLHPSRVARYAQLARSTAAAQTVRPLVVADSATPAALAAAHDAGVSVLVAPDSGRVTGALIDAQNATHAIATPGEKRDTSARAGLSRRTPWGSLAVALALLNDPTPRSQIALSRQTHLTQARVSQSIAAMSDFIIRSPDGWTVSDTNRAARWIVERYPVPTTTSSWLTLDDPVPATTAISDTLRAAGVRYAVTGQVAADVYAPWARPTHTTIWTDRLVDLSAAGCTPVRAADATVTIAVPDDPRALTDTRERRGLVLADPWRVWVTLAQDGDDDAATHLRGRLLAGTVV